MTFAFFISTYLAFEQSSVNDRAFLILMLLCLVSVRACRFSPLWRETADVGRFARIERANRDEGGTLLGFQRSQIAGHIREIRDSREAKSAPRMSNRTQAALMIDALNYGEGSSLRGLIRQQTNPKGIIRYIVLQRVVMHSRTDGSPRLTHTTTCCCSIAVCSEACVC